MQNGNIYLGNFGRSWSAALWLQSRKDVIRIFPLLKLSHLTVLAGSEVVVNGAQQWYQVAFHTFIDDTTLYGKTYAGQAGVYGLINSAPYLCCVVSIWLTPWLNRKLGRRGTIFWSSVFSILSPVLQALSHNKWELFAFRLLMGVGIGPKSATIPIYIAEVAPASIRGSLVMFWQVSRVPLISCSLIHSCP